MSAKGFGVKEEKIARAVPPDTAGIHPTGPTPKGTGIKRQHMGGRRQSHHRQGGHLPGGSEAAPSSIVKSMLGKLRSR